jgi:uncharacterized iron-regulated protein
MAYAGSAGSRRRGARPVVATLSVVLAACAGAHPQMADDGAQTAKSADCVPVGQWRIVGDDGLHPAGTDEVVTRALAAGVVLLGETHDSAEHHRWQLQMLTALHARHPQMMIALEMFPRRVQPVLDRWVAGELDERSFLRLSEWQQVWGEDPSLYMPIFDFARMNRVPLLAVNVDRELIRSIAERGLEAVPAAEREIIGTPAAPSEEYEDMLRKSWRAHQDAADAAHASDPAVEPSGTDDADFQRFVQSQLAWDRAMAQGIADARARQPSALVVGLMGSGHVMHGWGVAHQLRALGGPVAVALLAFDRDDDCKDLTRGIADAIFGIQSPAPPAPPVRPRLGVTLEPADGGVRITGVSKGSIAERSGLRSGDVIASIAGRPPAGPIDVAAAVWRQAPGTWLPIEILRDGRRIEVVAKFPAGPPPDTQHH